MSDVVLHVEALEAGYGGVKVLHGIDLEVRRGQLVALLGTNGVGKTTTMRAISGLLTPAAGRVLFLGEDITRMPAHERPYAGLVSVPEGRRVFGGMTNQENLEVGSFVLTNAAERRRRMDQVFALFPILAERRGQDAMYLSGGQQQMLAIGRALMAGPKLLLLDEPSMGLAPLMVEEVMRIVRRLQGEGVTVMLVEQNSRAALKIADYGYVLDTGRIALQAPAADLVNDERVVKTYLGIGGDLGSPRA